jgi:LemA protein
MALSKGCLIGAIIVAAVAFIILLIGGSLMVTYNNLVKKNEAINGAWAEIESQLLRRNDLIPNLVSTVEGYATHEKELFEHIADARARLAGANTIPDKMAASNELSSFLPRLIAIAENYPQLKANENFLKLQDELAGTENRINYARSKYNDIVRDYNARIKSFPTNMIAGMFGFAAKSYFEVPKEAKEVPRVKFGKTGNE